MVHENLHLHTEEISRALSRHFCGIPRFRKIPEPLIELKYSYVLLQISVLVLNLRVVPNFNRNGLRIHLALART